MEPSKLQTSASSRWYQPNGRLAIAAIAIIVFSVIVGIGFVRGYLDTASIYIDRYFAGESALQSTVIVITISAIIPTIVSLVGASILLSFPKRKVGIYITLAAVGTYFVMDAVFIGLIWDGHHVIQSYTNAEWLLRAFNQYGDYTGSIYVFYLVYIPALAGIVASLIIGWKRTNLHLRG
jgi:hypothetical protein